MCFTGFDWVLPSFTGLTLIFNEFRRAWTVCRLFLVVRSFGLSLGRVCKPIAVCLRARGFR